jgi:hypothetical protein
MANLTQKKTTAKNADKPATAIVATKAPSVAEVLAEQTKQAKVSASAAAIALSGNHGKAVSDAKEDREEEMGKMLSSLAHEIADNIKDDKAFTKFLAETVTWNEETAVKAYTLMEHIKAAVPADILARMPWPGTKLDQLPKGTNQLADEGKVRDDEGKLVATTFYRELAKAHPLGVGHLKTIAENMKEFTANKNTVAEGNIKRAKKALNILAQGMAQGGKLIIQIENFQMLTGLRMAWDTDEKGNLRRVPQPIIIAPVNDIRVRDKCSISQFLNYRIDRKLMKDAPEKVTFAMLKNSVKSKTVGQTHGDGKTGAFDQKNINDMAAAINGFVTCYRGGDPMSMTKRHSEFVEHMTKSDADRWSLVTLFRIVEPLVHANGSAWMKQADDYAAALDAASKGATDASAKVA